MKFKTVHDTVDDELGQRWCLGCGEFVFNCECGYISWFRRILLRIRRPHLDVDPYLGPAPIYERGNRLYCTYCTRLAHTCSCDLPSPYEVCDWCGRMACQGHPSQFCYWCGNEIVDPMHNPFCSKNCSDADHEALGGAWDDYPYDRLMERAMRPPYEGMAQ